MGPHGRVEYDEFSMFHENAEEYGIAYAGPPLVRRETVDVGDQRELSALVWGEGEPGIVLLHGGAQNAHTWDTVALALDRPLLAIDLPGHGHSDGGRNGSLDLVANATDVAAVIGALAPQAGVVAGMSLGGLTALALADRFADIVRSLALVDITPGVSAERTAPIRAFVAGPETFDSFDEILARTIEFNPTRTEASLRRGILHNALQLDDGTWVWRHARFRSAEVLDAGLPEQAGLFEHFDGWAAVSNLSVPLMLVRGMLPQSVVGDDDEAELLRRQPSARVERVQGAGHSVQGDRPLELAALLAEFADTAS